jgi:formate dehydrogenase major subunit
MGQTQHTIGNAIVRASCLLQLVLGNIGKSGGGTNIFRGHDNVQGATDVGRTLIHCRAILVWQRAPGSTGVMSGASITNGSSKFASQAMMEKSGTTVSRWIDAVLEKNELIDQENNVKAMVFWGMRRTRRRAVWNEKSIR